MLHGDFGTSALNGETVTSQLGTKLAVTAPLVLASTVLSVLVAVPLGIVAGARHRRADGIGLSVVSQLGIAVPSFWAGLMLIVVFGVHWNLFPAQGFPRDGWDDPAAAAESLVLPTVTLALSQGAVLLRFVRSATLDVLHQDYIRTARAKGLTRTQALYRHGLRNASLPIISILGVQIASLLAGVVVIERVFNLPGVGQMLVRDIGSRDLEKVQGTVLLLADHRARHRLPRRRRPPPRRPSPAGRGPDVRHLWRTWPGRLGIVLVGVLVLVGARLAGVDAATTRRRSFPADKWLPISWDHPFGTDGAGKDLLSQVLVGARTTLLVALLTVAHRGA